MDLSLYSALSRGISHATHVGGIIAARNNGFGTVGIAPRSTLLPITLDRNYHKKQYNRSGLFGLSYAALPDWHRRIAASVNYAADKKVFVISNSWGVGEGWYPREVRSTDEGQSSPYWFRLPNMFLDTAESDRFAKHRLIFNAEAVGAWERAVNGGAVVVFAAGNDGWNSETGKHKIYGTPLINPVTKQQRPWVDFRNERHLDYIKTRPRTVLLKDREIEIPANIPSLESSYFLTNDNLKGSWLAVVNVTRKKAIHWSSNGCGIARNYCIAAPGTSVLSTFARGDDDDLSDTKETDEERRQEGDSGNLTADGYGTYTGTSMAAPVVSGALAVLKSLNPNLTAKKAVEILLCTAKDLDKAPNRPAKSIEECSQKGVEATHTNGWEPSEVYGHGLVNLERALRPIGPQNAAGGSGRAVAPTGTTRIAFSSAFGNAAPSATHLFGGLDSYGRVYRYRAPLQDRVLPGPRLSGVLALNNPRPAMVIGRTSGTATYLRSSTDPHSAIGDGSALSVIGTKARIDLSVARSRTSSVLSPAALLAEGAGDRDTSAPPLDWGALAPQSRDLVSGGAGWQLSPRLAAGAYFSRALAEGATRRGEAYGMTDLGVSARIGYGDSGIGFHLGRLNEEGRFLGSKPEGGYALAGPTRSGYLRLSASRRLTSRLSVGVNVMKLRSRVDFRHDDFVADTDITARSAGAHLALRDAGRKGDRLVLHYGEPLAVTGGAIRQSSVTGYTAGGAYKPAQSSLDLGVRSRHRMTQVMYRAPLAGGISGFAAAAHHRNWSHQRGLGNNLVMFGLSLRR